MSKIESEAVNNLFRAVLSLESVEECYKFFEDICTVKELLDISQRLEVASMLMKKNLSYNEISERTGASTTTISRISKSLNYGNDGYQLVLGRIE